VCASWLLRNSCCHASLKNALERLLEAQGKAGRLESAVLVRTEIEAFKADEIFDEILFRHRLSSQPELRTVQSTYLRERGRITAVLQPHLTAATREYDQRLGKLQDRLTKALQHDDAVKVGEIREQLKQDPKGAMAAALREAGKSPQLVAAAAGGLTRSAETGFAGRVLFVIKGDAELFHNGQNVAFEDSSDQSNQVGGRSEVRSFRPGDTVVLKARSPWTTRSLVLAIQSPDGTSEVAVKTKHWRLIGVDHNPLTVTAEVIRECKTAVLPGRVDDSARIVRDHLKMRPEEQGGSAWVHLPQSNQSYTMGFVIDANMIPKR